MTVVEVPSGTPAAAQAWLGGRFRLGERISLDEQVSGPCGPSLEASGLSMWKATDRLLGRSVTIYLLPPGQSVPRVVTEAVQAAARVNDPRLATVYDTDFAPECPYVVSEWTPGTHLEDLVLSGLPDPALAAAMIADAADAIAVAHQARCPHLRLTPRSLRWDTGSGLKITGLGIDAALCGIEQGGMEQGGTEPEAARIADTRALGRMLYALLTGYWPGEDTTALPPAPRHKGEVCTPRQVRAGVPAMLDAITFRALRGQAADAPLRPQTPAGLAMALRMVQRPSYQLTEPEEESAARMPSPAGRPSRRHGMARHARDGSGPRQSSLLLRSR